MKGVQSEDDFGIVAEINMIPLIDVSLVLLIIFMVMTPILVQSQIKLKLPVAGNVDKASDATPMRITVTANGGIFVDDKPVADGDLTELIRQRVTDPEGGVVVEGDTASDLGIAVKVFDAARDAGVSKIGVAVQTKPSARTTPPARGGAARPAR